MLTRELLKKIRAIEIVTERLVRDRMAGHYHSVFKGSGLAFSEVREEIASGLQFLGRIARRRAVAFLVSDFLAPPASYERALRIMARRHDLVPVTVTDPLEEALPSVGLVELEDPETGDVVVFDTSG